MRKDNSPAERQHAGVLRAFASGHQWPLALFLGITSESMRSKDGGYPNRFGECSLGHGQLFQRLVQEVA
jgi:hypothetical protein